MRTPLLTAIALGLAAALVVVPGPAAASSDQGEVRSDTPDIAVGVQLEALADVTIGEAEIAKGSKVSVIKLLHRQGRLASIDVELADGYVARVEMGKVKAFFRVVSD